MPVDNKLANYAKKHMSSHENKEKKSSEWYTPLWLLEKIKLVMGEIVLDPASSEEANRNVNAFMYLTESDNALELNWKADTVFLNPPSQTATAPWFSKFTHEYEKGNFREGMYLFYRWSSETKVSQHAMSNHFVLMFNKRLKFGSPEGTYEKPENNSPLVPSAMMYVGKNSDKFYQVFREHGHITIPDHIAHDWVWNNPARLY